MIKRSKLIAVTMITALSVSVLPAVTSVGSYAADTTTSASVWTQPATPAPVVTPAKPVVTAPAPVQPAQVSTTAAPATVSNILRMLAEGSFGEDVKLIQTMLNNLSYKLKVDGIFGQLTSGAVKDFQGKNSLSVDGIVGPKTLSKLAPFAPAASTVGVAVDTVATASIVDNNANFEKAISKDGFWLIAILKDLTFDKPLVLDGTLTKEDGTVSRKIALYTQDEDHNVVDSFKLTAPKLTVLSPSGRLQNGAFVGDIYVNAAKFEIRNTKVTGNVYVSETGFKLTGAQVTGTVFYMNQAAKDGATVDAKTKVSGGVVLAELDAVTSPSVVDSITALEKGVSKNGKWITSIVRDLKTDKEIVIDGFFYDGKTDAVTGEKTIKRKLSLYSQDDKRNITRKFTLTAPKVTVNSPNTVFQGGIYNGDVYVSATGFNLVKQAVNGNIYFMNQAAKDSFKMDALSTVNGQKVLVQLDAVTTASLVDTGAAFEKGISKDGTWIISIAKDLVINKALVLDGDFLNGKGASQRKIALYSQDDAHVVTRMFTLMAQRLTVKSPDARIQGGTFDGNVYVEAKNFQLVNTTVDGNIYFMNEEAKSTFKMDAASKVTGIQVLKTN